VNAFRATLQGDSSGVMVEVPAEVLEALASPSRRAAVRVRINGAELRTTIAVYGGKSYIGLRREYREAAGIAPGDDVDIAVELDTEPRGGVAPKGRRRRTPSSD
jgi:hypothetical protein